VAIDSLAKLREVFAPLVAEEREWREGNPAVRDVPCVNCGLRWWNERGRDGEVYCSICLGRGRDEPDEA